MARSRPVDAPKSTLTLAILRLKAFEPYIKLKQEDRFLFTDTVLEVGSNADKVLAFGDDDLEYWIKQKLKQAKPAPPPRASKSNGGGGGGSGSASNQPV